MFLDLLRSPSAFLHDRWGYARNQLGHGYLVGGLALFLPVWAVLAGYWAWEMVQIDRYRARPWDSVEDFANVAVIAFAVTIPAASLHLMAVHALYLLAGFLRRLHADG